MVLTPFACVVGYILYNVDKHSNVNLISRPSPQITGMLAYNKNEGEHMLLNSAHVTSNPSKRKPLKRMSRKAVNQV
jgi:hypothetical protein